MLRTDTWTYTEKTLCVSQRLSYKYDKTEHLVQQFYVERDSTGARQKSISGPACYIIITTTVQGFEDSNANYHPQYNMSSFPIQGLSPPNLASFVSDSVTSGAAGTTVFVCPDSDVTNSANE